MASSSSASASTAPESVSSTPEKLTPRTYPSGFRFSSAVGTKHMTHDDKKGKSGKLHSSAASTPGLGYYGNSAKQGVANQPGSAIVASQMFKTKLCIDNQTKGCSRGSECPYAHSVDEMRSLPDLRKTKMCSLVLSGKGCKNKACRFAHSESELRYTCNFSEFKTRICRFAQEQGGRGCLYGVRCPYAHSPSELRHLESPTISPTEILVQDRRNRVAFVAKSPHTRVVSSSRPASALKTRPEVAKENQTVTPDSLEHQLQGRHGCRPSFLDEELKKGGASRKTLGESFSFSVVKKLNAPPETTTGSESNQASTNAQLHQTENHPSQCKSGSYSHTEKDGEQGSSSQGKKDREASCLARGVQANSTIPRSLAGRRRAATENAGKAASKPIGSIEPRHDNLEGQAFLIRDRVSGDKPVAEGEAVSGGTNKESTSPLLQTRKPPSFLVSPANSGVPPASTQEREQVSSPCKLIENAGLDAHRMARVLSVDGLRGMEVRTSGTPSAQTSLIEKSRIFKQLGATPNTVPATSTYWAPTQQLPSLNTGFSTEEIFFPAAPRSNKMDGDVFDSVLPTSLPHVPSSSLLDKRNATLPSSETNPLPPPPGFEHIRPEKTGVPYGRNMPDSVSETFREGPLASSFSENSEVDQHEQLFLQLQRQLLLQCWGKMDEDSLLLSKNLTIAPTGNSGGRTKPANKARMPVPSDLSNEIFSRQSHTSRLPVDWDMWERELQGEDAQPSLGDERGFLSSSATNNTQFLDVHIPQALFIGKVPTPGEKSSRNNGLGTLSVREKGGQTGLDMRTGRKRKEIQEELGELMVAAGAWESGMAP
uniref:Zinc finger (CCCH type) motif-containing protein n=1 Tax=Toxoplasma gondii COUG TaxID=1074873 RepID=A0A2G8Y8N5_TOXGO|nr:zinc finger (CCCH type) motif-containing protein [Toxoplasma gondii COUG]